MELHLTAMGLAIWDHTVLPATQHKWTHPTLNPARQARTLFTYPGGMEGWVDLKTDKKPVAGASKPGGNETIFRKWTELKLRCPAYIVNI